MTEEILGIIEIDHRLLCFTSNRIIVAKTGGGGAATGAKIAFGLIGRALADRAEKKRRESLEKLSPESVLKSDKHNFAVPYSGIVRVEMRKVSPYAKRVKIIADQKFGDYMKKKKDETTQKYVYIYEEEIKTKKEFEDHVNLVRSVLPDKVDVIDLWHAK